MNEVKTLLNQLKEFVQGAIDKVEPFNDDSKVSYGKSRDVRKLMQIVKVTAQKVRLAIQGVVKSQKTS